MMETDQSNHKNVKDKQSPLEPPKKPKPQISPESYTAPMPPLPRE